MKLRIVVILGLAAIVSLAPSAALAQRVGGGPKAGVTFSSLSGEFADPDFSNVSFEYGPGFAIGGFIAVPMGNSGLFQPEFYFVRRMTTGVESALNIETEIRLDYFEIPVLFKYSRAASGRTSPTFFAGPSVAFEVAAKAKDLTPGGAATEDIADDLVDVEFGFVFGGGVDFASGLQIDVRYYWGLSNIVKDDSVGVGIVDPSDDFKNRMFAVMVGFSF
jgi:hypothetical protein